MSATASRNVVAAAVTEKQFQSAIIEVFVIHGWMVFHPYDSRRSVRGFPDLCCAHPKHGVVFIECKTLKGRCTPEQLRWLQTLGASGQRACVLRPGDEDKAVALAQGKPLRA